MARGSSVGTPGEFSPRGLGWPNCVPYFCATRLAGFHLHKELHSAAPRGQLEDNSIHNVFGIHLINAAITELSLWKLGPVEGPSISVDYEGIVVAFEEYTGLQVYDIVAGEHSWVLLTAVFLLIFILVKVRKRPRRRTLAVDRWERLSRGTLEVIEPLNRGRPHKRDLGFSGGKPAHGSFVIPGLGETSTTERLAQAQMMAQASGASPQQMQQAYEMAQQHYRKQELQAFMRERRQRKGLRSAFSERQAEAERQFKEVGEAYAVLSNQESRQRYDAGGFVGDIADFLPGGKSFDPKQMFEVFQKMQAGQGGRVFTGEMS